MGLISRYLFGVKKYKVTYLSTGMMGNKYVSGVFVFEASRSDLKAHKSAASYGFYMNYKLLIKHYNQSKSVIEYSSITEILDGNLEE